MSAAGSNTLSDVFAVCTKAVRKIGSFAELMLP